MELSIFDTHADTPYELHKNAESLDKNSLHISLELASKYKNYCQCMAIWSDKKLSDDEAFFRFTEIEEYFRKCVCDSKRAELCRTYTDIERTLRSAKRAFMLTVEDARLLAGDIRRLDTLAERGVRILTFQWEGETCIGGGFDTDVGLSEFGRQVARACAKYRIIPDISHSNEKTAREIIDITSEHGRPVIATHSNSYAVCPHKRNMTDSLYNNLIRAGGIVGISLAPQHLSLDSTADAETVLRHIDHYAETGGIEHICLGCDLDGISSTPRDIRNIADLDVIAESMLRHGYSDEDVRALFYENATRFFAANLQ